MVEFLSPLGWLVAIAALVPVGAAVLRARRDGAVRMLLGLAPPGRAAQAATLVAATLAVALVAAASARPAVRTTGTSGLRTDAQVFFVLDISRSMLARLPHGRTRYGRAVAATLRLRNALGDVPSGLASLTDRPLPHLFPTGDRHVFSEVLHRAIGIQRPPSEAGRNVYGIATNFDPLAQIATAHYFGASARRRLAIVLTDGESNLYSPETVARALHRAHIDLLVVRFWHLRERVYTASGRLEPYRPEPTALRPLEHLAAGTGGRVFSENDLVDVVKAARDRLGSGPLRRVGTPRRVELAPYFALAAVLPVAFVLRRRDR